MPHQPPSSTSPKPAPVSVENWAREQGKDPYADQEKPGPINVALDVEGIEQFPVPPRFPVPEVIVRCGVRGVPDRGFTFGRDAEWGTTWARAEEMAGQVSIIKVLTPKPDADATGSN